MIIPIFKPLGQSSHQLAKQIGEISNEKATHTGTLDPMADGVLVVLTGDDRFDKEKYTNWKKEYLFKMILGVSTDSHDLLGLQTNNISSKNYGLVKNHEKIKQDIQQILIDLTGKRKQIVPSFSARRYQGKSSFDFAKEKIKIKEKKQEITIFSLDIKNIETIKTSDLESIIISKVKSVKGDFRQKEILNNWKTTIKKMRDSNIKELPIFTIEAVTSKKTYIRGIVRDIGNLLKIPATTFSITRTKNGDFSLEDCHIDAGSVK